MEIPTYNPYEFDDEDIAVLEGIGRMFGFTLCLPPTHNTIKNPFYYIDKYSDKKQYEKMLSALHFAGFFIKPQIIKKKKYLEILKSENLTANME